MMRIFLCFVVIALCCDSVVEAQSGRNSMWLSGSSVPSVVNFEKNNGSSLVVFASNVATETVKRPSTNKQIADSNRKESKILKWSNTSEKLNLSLSLVETQTVEINVFNIIGKKVMDLDRRVMDEGDREYEYELRDKDSKIDIPNGIYIVTVQGSNFRSSVKIIVSRQ